MPNILLVEDEKSISDYYATALNRAGFEVTTADNRETALKHFEQSQIDLVLLDITLGEDTEAGFHVCAEIRAISDHIPIIFLTSLDGTIDKSSGMRLGADDYITKDIDIDYLIIRLKALLRRYDVLTKKEIIEQPKESVFGDLVIDMDTLTATWKNKPVKLTLTHLWMVHALVSNKNYIRSPQQLMEAASIFIQQTTLVVHIGTIRKLFQEVDPDFSAIKTERGIGYRWVDDD